MGGTQLKRSLTDLLLYSLLTGWEWWDVLMAAHIGTPPDTLEAVSRQFTDEFRIQDIPQQHIRLSRFRAIKASLFRCMKDGAGQAVDCYVCQLLVAIAAAFRSLLKSSHTAAEQLAKISSTLDLEVDKVLQVLDTKELSLDSSKRNNPLINEKYRLSLIRNITAGPFCLPAFDKLPPTFHTISLPVIDSN